MATMEDIAKKLGVTKGTVSKAMSGAPDISEATRVAVMETAVEMGYSRLIRKGAEGEGKRVCVFIEHMVYEKPEDFGWGFITGFRKMAEPAGYTVAVEPLTAALEKEEGYETYMMRHNYRGAFFLGLTLSDPWMKEIDHCHVPTVLYDNRVKHNPTVSTVGIDNEEGMELAIGALRDLGHTRIGYLSSGLGSYIFQLRYKAYLRALRQYGLKEDLSLVGKSFYTSENMETHLPRLLYRGCTAIVCSHDLLAHAVLIHCGELGVRIPEDVSIIGFDDLPLCRYMTPPLTSIRQDTEEIGRSAFYALLSQMGHIPISSLLLHPELKRRKSLGRCPGT